MDFGIRRDCLTVAGVRACEGAERGEGEEASLGLGVYGGRRGRLVLGEVGRAWVARGGRVCRECPVGWGIVDGRGDEGEGVGEGGMGGVAGVGVGGLAGRVDKAGDGGEQGDGEAGGEVGSHMSRWRL